MTTLTTTPSIPALDALTTLLAQLSAVAGDAHGAYDTLADVEAQVSKCRGALARFMADPPADASPNAIGFAQNVLHALDGVDRLVTDAMNAQLALARIFRDCTAATAPWVEACTPVPPAPAPPVSTGAA